MAATAPRKPAAKRPPVSDRKPKQVAAAQKAEATDGKMTVSLDGKDWTVNFGLIDDFDFLEIFGAAMNGNPFAMPEALTRLLGDEQYEALKALLRDENGRLDTVVVSDYLLRLFQGTNPNS